MKLHYRTTNHQTSTTPIVLLHGWGGSKDSFVHIERTLSLAGHMVINVDLYGFGDSPEPEAHYGIHEYAAGVRNLLDQLGYSQYYLIGHSFGGRLCLLLGSDARIKRIILCAAAGMRPRRGMRYHTKVAHYKMRKLFGLDVAGFGSSDYKSLSEAMRPVFVRIVNQHLEGQLPAVSAATLIVWGKQDDQTPLYMARRLHRGIKGSGLIVLDQAGHYCYMEHGGKFALIAQEFFK
jgi:pimeloyl-ACP methyl ester carboxylesterase